MMVIKPASTLWANSSVFKWRSAVFAKLKVKINLESYRKLCNAPVSGTVEALLLNKELTHTQIKKHTLQPVTFVHTSVT